MNAATRCIMAFALAASAPLCTAKAPAAADEVLAVWMFNIGDREVPLAKVKRANGDVCQSYVKSVSRNDIGEKDVTVSRICDRPASIKTMLGPEIIYPLKLRALREVTTDGITVQVPELAK